ncbi:hypothetical protein ACFWFI_16810 [Streptomyces sp. NPDC060209]|uniref:hypothetical protein n=1 Tax=Streptomyces sp. NPDC060209 TaxID=3347073 RepID=UPI003646E463
MLLVSEIGQHRIVAHGAIQDAEMVDQLVLQLDTRPAAFRAELMSGPIDRLQGRNGLGGAGGL